MTVRRLVIYRICLTEDEVQGLIDDGICTVSDDGTLFFNGTDTGYTFPATPHEMYDDYLVDEAIDFLHNHENRATEKMFSAGYVWNDGTEEWEVLSV